MCKQVVVSTEQGDLYIFENLEFRCALATPTTDGAAICNLAAFSKGFVTGGANGVLRVFERSDDPREFFKCLKVKWEKERKDGLGTPYIIYLVDTPFSCRSE